MKRKPLAVVLLSGGMDSCVTAAIAKQDHDLALLHLNYGQRTERKELECFGLVGDFYECHQRLVVPMKHLEIIGGSSLTDRTIPVSNANLNSKEVPSSYVPFRNANMLSIAVSWAEVLGADSIFVGAVQEDSSGYPDCRVEFYEAFNRLIETGTKPSTHISIKTPVIMMSKMEIILRGMTLGAPLHLTWSCYQREDTACGVCDSCALRLRAFRSAGIEDPISYLHRPVYA